MLGYIISDKEEINVEEREIQSFYILHKTNLNIFVVKNDKVLYKNNIIYNACWHGHVQVLEWFKNSGYKFKHNKKAINWASSNGYVQVLEWFKNSGYKFKYDKNAIKWASYFKYHNRESFYNTSSKNKILEWFKNQNVKKVIKWSTPLKFNKTIKFKTKNNYIKGYNKN